LTVGRRDRSLYNVAGPIDLTGGTGSGGGLFYGDEFKIECPTGSGKQMNLFEVPRELANRLTAIFLRNTEGRRPVYGGSSKFQTDPHWRDHVLFYEYFHGDNGAGLGASHQTAGRGWRAVRFPHRGRRR